MKDLIVFTNLQQTQACVAFAEELGTKELIVLFDNHSTKNSELFDALESTIKLSNGLLVGNQKEAQKHSKNYNYIVGQATRALLESKAVTHVFEAEELEDKDKTHYRGAGINQVHAKLMKDKTYVFSLALVMKGKTPHILGRMQQNKVILDKYGVKTVCYSFAKEPLDLRAGKERKLFLDNL